MTARTGKASAFHAANGSDVGLGYPRPAAAQPVMCGRHAPVADEPDDDRHFRDTGALAIITGRSPWVIRAHCHREPDGYDVDASFAVLKDIPELILVNAPDAERYLGIRAATVRQWAHRGLVHSCSSTYGGRRPSRCVRSAACWPACRRGPFGAKSRRRKERCHGKRRVQEPGHTRRDQDP
jgi:hypothetical protein